MCVPVCELRKSSSRLYPSSLILDQSINFGFGEPGKLGMDSEMVSVRSTGFTSIERIGD